MFRRRAKGTAAEQAGTAESAAPEEPVAPDPGADPGKPARANGPWDVSELDGSHASHGRSRIDLGALRVRPLSGMRLQMQVDNATGKATSVLIIGDQAAVQLMAIAAAKSTPLWPQTRGGVKADASRRGGTVNEAPGPWGPVLQVALPATTSEGAKGVQPSLIIGIDGPRWMLRATLLGKAAVDQQVHNQMLAIVQDTVVVRGEQPMAPGELLELRPPPRPEDVPGDADGDGEASNPGV
jgi:hypothetical protein